MKQLVGCHVGLHVGEFVQTGMSSSPMLNGLPSNCREWRISIRVKTALGSPRAAASHQIAQHAHFTGLA